VISSNRSAGTSPRGPTDAGTPVGPGDARQRKPSPSYRAGVSMPTLAVYLQEVTKGAPARRRCRMIAGAAALTAALPPSVLPGGCGPASGSQGLFAHRLPPLLPRPPTPGQGPVRGSGITSPRASR
jgi:hypothetical protein